MKMKLELVVVHNPNQRTVVPGLEVDVNIKDLRKVIATEQLLERLLGMRVHLNEVHK